ncbi:spermatogenesis-associated protein 13-like [Rhopilema esculentum]|uniref:spermatogenesis-associated protein 13-like n=1 Tax=Rhopilema esculentum TaxID=499914 RepID=UPI0031DFE904
MVEAERGRANRRRIMDIKFSFRRKKKIRLDGSDTGNNVQQSNDIGQSSSSRQSFGVLPRIGREEAPRSIFSRLLLFRRKKGKAQSACNSSPTAQDKVTNTYFVSKDENNQASSHNEEIVYNDGSDQIYNQLAYHKTTSLSSPNLVCLKRLSIDSLRETETLGVHNKHGSFRRSRASLVFPVSEVQNSFMKFDCLEQSSSKRDILQATDLDLDVVCHSNDILSSSVPSAKSVESRQYIKLRENTKTVESFVRTNDGRSPHPGKRNLNRLHTFSSPNVFKENPSLPLAYDGHCFSTVCNFQDLDNQIHGIHERSSSNINVNSRQKYVYSRDVTKKSSFAQTKDRKDINPENKRLGRFVSCPYMLEVDRSQTEVAPNIPFHDQRTVPYSSHRRPYSVHESVSSLDFLEDSQRRGSEAQNDNGNGDDDSDQDSAPEDQLSLPSKDLPLAFGEALWDYTGEKKSELSFRAEETIAVYFMSKKRWWWGTAGNGKGWFPASNVRLRIDQESSVLEPKANHNTISVLGIQATMRSKGEVRSKCINELLTTEKDYVKTLKDVTEGYLIQSRKRPDLFSQDDIAIIFCNIEDILKLHEEFFEKLRRRVNKRDLFKTEIGDLFISHKNDFDLYSEYCNNHPNANIRLHGLQREKRYKLFFESCRLIQQMIPLSIDAFLLTPVQKICKYPLQLNELLKHTPVEHPDYGHLQLAVHEMKEVASLINERKKKFEDLNSIAEWQLSVEAWQGDDVLEVSCEKVKTGVVESLFGGKRENIFLSLFDYLLVLCKVDLSKKQRQLVYYSRFDLDDARVDIVGDVAGQKSSNVIRVTSLASNNTFWFSAGSKVELDSWHDAFKRERRIVESMTQSGTTVPMSIRRAAMASARSKNKLEMTKGHRRRKSLTDPFQDFGTGAIRRSLRLRRTQSLRDRKFFN